ncbi:pyridoxamine 5'-phosphate oxidase family protein [Streptomyces sp. AK02-01A]|uniref:pyridoxamine 5'-phosphate oxidase family protein n=1 Tax=Streptomyces sp. AK02-01A TaxID=3028648 RepID=UPI0029AF3A29|nr:pyridoxamine 5'-phosphate oxidase family protein [Streptomyces sp. AK02-01A]MDX3849958.1 pyridoxamine 5'-phosphate oxidase family protein [Streptomyces sp. AK02-01A]
MSTTGFHEGELAVQQRAGVQTDAARLEGMLRPARLSGGVATFLSQRDLAFITGRDHTGRLWTSPLLGAPGFLDGRNNTLKVHIAPVEGDPLFDLPAGQEVGLLAIDFALRRRVRVNGTLVRSERDSLLIEADQAFGNCPSYIQRRAILVAERSAEAVGECAAAAGTGRALTADQTRVITEADTFLLGTTHPTRGADTSHKGGSPGFVRIDGDTLWWPDYAGNNMFNSMGNIAVDPAASLLFVDFTSGRAVYLSGTAELRWTTVGSSGDDGGTGRQIRFHPERSLTTALALRADHEIGRSPDNPALRR